jgi:hypothetical protein
MVLKPSLFKFLVNFLVRRPRHVAAETVRIPMDPMYVSVITATTVHHVPVAKKAPHRLPPSPPSSAEL